MIAKEENILYQTFKVDIQENDVLDRILQAFILKEIPKNDFLLKEGQIANSYHFIQDGFFRSFAVNTNGNDITTGFFAKGNILWEVSSLFLNEPSQENIQAIRDSLVWEISMDKFEELFNANAAFREAGRTRLVKNYSKLKQRSLAMITKTAEERYTKLINEQPGILHEASLQHVATYLGITNSSLSRIRKEMALKKDK